MKAAALVSGTDQGRRRRRWHYRRVLRWLGTAFGLWIVVAYLALPGWWEMVETHHPGLSDASRVTTTGSDIPGDALNLFLIGTQKELVAGMLAAGWHPADPVTLKTSLEIVGSSVFHRPYDDAPVSPLYLFGRVEDLAFEKPVGHDPRQRHHVRFWQTVDKDASGKPAWWGAATYDQSVGFSHTTGQITHHIAPDIDAERDALLQDLQKAGKIGSTVYRVEFQAKNGRNGGGDPWFSDGRLGIARMHP